MSKVTLNSIADITSSSTAQTTINTDLTTIQTAFDNTLSRDGTSPNTMNAGIDMNSNQIVNLPSPTSLNSPARLADVQNLVAGGSITLSPLPTGGTQNQILMKNSSANFDASWLSNISIVGIAGQSLTINPAGTSIAGITVSQTLSGASLPAGNAANLIFISSDVAQGASAFINGFEVSHVIGGAAMTGGRQSNATFLDFNAATNAANPNRNYVALYGNFFATAPDGGTNTGAGAQGAGFGLATWSDLQSGATNWLDVGPEFDISIRTGASAKNKHCLSLVQHALDQVSGASLDTLLSLCGQTGALGMNSGITFDTHGGQAALKTTGTAILVSGAQTMANFIDASSATITGNFLKSTGFTVDGSGNVAGVAYTGTSISTTGAHTAFSGTAVPAGGTTGTGFKMSSTANLGIFFGSSTPTLSAAQGSLYIRTDGSSTSTRMYINTNGSTTWTNVTTAA